MSEPVSRGRGAATRTPRRMEQSVSHLGPEKLTYLGEGGCRRWRDPPCERALAGRPPCLPQSPGPSRWPSLSSCFAATLGFLPASPASLSFPSPPRTAQVHFLAADNRRLQKMFTASQTSAVSSESEPQGAWPWAALSCSPGRAHPEKVGSGAARPQVNGVSVQATQQTH